MDNRSAIYTFYNSSAILNKPLHYDQRLAELDPVHLTDIIYTIGNVKLTQYEIHLYSKRLKFIPNQPFHITDHPLATVLPIWLATAIPSLLSLLKSPDIADRVLPNALFI
ncbi:unnamed protein product [Didymodactylos carnosus]|uniref:Uncharacterized protein n=1 Tax=Didymodactylos carnosus TaxID=1234261 RepID=A0A815XNP0_9BILA|nr:unnamed protein product [Didymodactylos carnosus]CAF1559781.1 unnamed protein product [Didymodactylos carnosus]CAF3632503.1 unnamed protein product [Didymodactylos carnosus]CAF4421134.1 unnamed protein product [Didymodactylos carnosus]